MQRVILPVALSVSVLSLAACTGQTPAPGERAARPVRVPPGCERSQAGAYHHAENPTYRYLATDDGSTLSLTAYQSPADGGTGTPDAGTATIVLARTPDGFIGETHGTGFSTTGTPCPVTFPTEVTKCGAEGLTLRSAASTVIAEDCRATSGAAAPQRVEQRLVRETPAAATPKG
ncbi:hypothetical protein P2318_26575 [Myxococcaceae bacterium GXIMD 01537]